MAKGKPVRNGSGKGVGNTGRGGCKHPKNTRKGKR